MDLELVDGYPVNDHKKTSNRCALGDDRMDMDNDDFHQSESLRGDVFRFVKEAENSEVNSHAPTLAIVPNITVEKVINPKNKEHESITKETGFLDEKNILSQDNNNSVNKDMVLNKKKEIVKRNFDNDEADNTEDCLNRYDDSPVKRKKHSSKQREAERKRLRRLTVRKLKKMKDADTSLWKYLLTRNIGLRFYKIES